MTDQKVPPVPPESIERAMETRDEWNLKQGEADKPLEMITLDEAPPIKKAKNHVAKVEEDDCLLATGFVRKAHYPELIDQSMPKGKNIVPQEIFCLKDSRVWTSHKLKKLLYNSLCFLTFHYLPSMFATSLRFITLRLHLPTKEKTYLLSVPPLLAMQSCRVHLPFGYLSRCFTLTPAKKGGNTSPKYPITPRHLVWLILSPTWLFK